jgi:phosphoribosyl 1,2-cyclic phosphate phosphodiesterase
MMGVDDLRQFNRLQDETIPIYLPRAFESEFMGAFGYTFKEAPAPLYRPKLSMSLIDPGEVVTFDGLNVRFVPVMHGSDEIAAYLFSTSHMRMAYVSECKSITLGAMEMLQNLDVLIIGAIWDMDKEHPNHLTLAQALDLIDQLSPVTSYVTHVTHLMGLHTVVSKDLPPSVHLAYDGLTLAI